MYNLLKIGLNLYLLYILYLSAKRYIIKPKVKVNKFTDIKFNDIVGIDEYKEEL
jgi:hypothetical protein